MILIRTPFRISFFGGSTDYPAWCNYNPGAVLSTTINKYCYLMLRNFPPFFDYKYRIRYRITEKRKRLNDIVHPTVRECLKFTNIDKGIEIVHTADIPARSGIGSSSAFTVCLLHGLYALKGEMISKRKLASDAIHVEQDIIGENVGCQDQVACSFGGLNRIEFFKNSGFEVEKLPFKEEILTQLENHIMMFFVGFPRTSSEIAGRYVCSLLKKEKVLKKMYDMVDVGISLIRTSNFIEFGRLLNESWDLKKKISNEISNRNINEVYDITIKEGALGAKLCGSGGGGFLMVFAEDDKQEQIKKALKKFLYVPIKFDFLGSQIMMYNEQNF